VHKELTKWKTSFMMNPKNPATNELQWDPKVIAQNYRRHAYIKSVQTMPK
jgi:hypothetical protein